MISSSTRIYSPVVNLELPALDAVGMLFQALHAQSIRYVHWKSNIRLDLSLQGGTDLDLLVDREQSQAFRQILMEQDIKPILPPAGQRYPAMEHYLGFDPASGKLFHLHIHYQLILGEEYIKNFRLPLEEQFLSQVRSLYGVITPVPELEIIILSIRVLLKYRDRDALKDILSIRSAGIKKYFRQELDWLLSQTSMEQIAKTLEPLAAVIPGPILLDFLQTFQQQPRAGFHFVTLRRQLRRALSQYQRSEPLKAAAAYFSQMWQRRKTFARISPATRMTLPEGGLTLALVGVDGAGKSTLRKEISQWLSWKMDVQSYYLGSKQPSLKSALLYKLFRILRRSHRIISAALPEQNILSRGLAKARQSSLYSHHISIAKDRQQRYQEGVRKSASGSIVMFDRFPLSAFPAIVDSHHLDGPQIQRLASDAADISAGKVIGAEEDIYSTFQTPDALILLMVSPQVSLQRKPDHRPEAIEAKFATLSQMVTRSGRANDPSTTGKRVKVIQINADNSLDAVIHQLKGEVWKLI